MTSTELKDYIKILMGLESSVYEQVNSTIILDKEYKNWESNALRQIKSGKPEKEVNIYDSPFGIYTPSLCWDPLIYVVASVISGGVLGGLLSIPIIHTHWFELLKEASRHKNIFIELGVYLIPFIIATILPQVIWSLIKLWYLITGKIRQLRDKDKREKEHQRIEEKYKHDMAKWESNLPARQGNEYEKPKAEYLHRLSEAKNNFNSTWNLLEDYYSNNVIHPKYRNLSALCSIYEYLDTGRCDKLEGPDGAYNMYETELRLDRIIFDLDEIRKDIEVIKNNQFTLYKCMEEINSNLVKIAGIGSNILHNRELDTYYTRIIAYNTMAEKEATKFALYSDLSSKSVRLGKPKK